MPITDIAQRISGKTITYIDQDGRVLRKTTTSSAAGSNYRCAVVGPDREMGYCGTFPDARIWFCRVRPGEPERAFSFHSSELLARRQIRTWQLPKYGMFEWARLLRVIVIDVSLQSIAP